MYALVEIVYLLRGILLELLGCHVEEDLSSLCHGIFYSVPW